MLFIGEKINGMFKAVKKAIELRDKKTILSLAEHQLEKGAHYLDVNVGAVSNGIESMEWLVNCLQEIDNVKLCIDSAKADVLSAGLKLCKERPILNSINADPEKIAELIPIALEYDTLVIALTMDDKGVPATVDGRVELAAMILALCEELNFNKNNIYLDPLILPLNVAQDCPLHVLEAISMIKKIDIPAPKTILGLSNISQKCSNKRLINRTFMSMAMYCGLDGAILDVTDEELVNTAITSRIILNKDIYCDSYIESFKTNDF